jgi:hypothetical protein
MYLINSTFEILFCLFLIIPIFKAFTPSKDLQYLVELLNSQLKTEINENDLLETKTLTHMDILKKGFISSLVKYFKELKHLDDVKLARQVDSKKIEIYFNDIDELFRDYYNDSNFNSYLKCNYKFNKVIQSLSDSIANVDFDSILKDLPHAHFDGDLILESNKYLADLIEQTYYYILSSNHNINGINEDALNKIGQALHTIHDFYAHSNWVEMGFDDINYKLGTYVNDLGVTLSENEPNIPTCFDNNCTKHVIMCNHLNGLSILSEKLSGITINCPIVYYKCKNNVITDKLTSGYFGNQKLDNGKDVIKPIESKCNHGGYLDKNNGNIAVGGINKDTGYYILSPHADLHARAANLAIKHTEFYFDQLRNTIGNGYFDDLFGILHRPHNLLNCIFKRLYFLG